MRRLFLSVVAVALLAAFPIGTGATCLDDLKTVYESRPDLQAIFRPTDWKIRDSVADKYDLTDLEDWARKWGHKEHECLLPYSPLAIYGTYKDALQKIYEQRLDLQAIFDPNTWKLRPASSIKEMTDLEDWAGQWGRLEYPGILEIYGRSEPEAPQIDPLSPIDFGKPSVHGPTMKSDAVFPFSLVTADSMLVVDAASGEVLLSRNSLAQWPIASITKLMTAMVVLDNGVSMDKIMTLEQADEVGGARLRVDVGSSLTVQNLFFATLVGSANNTAHAMARSTGLTIPGFVSEMNRKAAEIGLENTRFADPTGLEVDNMSNARDIAKMISYALDNYYIIRVAASTAKKQVFTVSGEMRELENTDKLLTDPNNGLYVLGGKTGYLIESQWNLALKVKDSRNRPVIAVTFGSDANSWVFSETERAVKWVWDNYVW